jgi:hypothetical protein
MHYFIEHTNLPQQDASDTFGVVSSDPTNKFNITSRFQLTNQAKAFACQDGMMIVQQSDVDTSLVNIIIKPIENLKVNLNNIKYFVYRGILKSSLIIDDDTIVTEASTNNEFIARLWQDHNHFKTEFNLPNLTNPTPKVFGYDNSLSVSLNIEKIYGNSQEDTQSLLVKQGEWFGDFATTHKIGIEIFTSNERTTIDLTYLRKEKHQIDTTGLTNLELRAKKEEILSFIDPASFWGLHYDYGVKVSTFSGGQKTTEKKKQDDLFNLLIDNFYTKSRVYLDVRSEFGYSYNFYQNYNDDTSKNIKVGNSTITPIAENYGMLGFGWPIIAIDNPINTSNNFNDVIFQLRIDDNIKPILFIEYTELLTDGSRTRFIDETKLLVGASTDWSKEIKLKFPNTGSGAIKNNVAYYIRVYYHKQEMSSTSSPNTVISKANQLDFLFGSLDMLNLGDTEYTFQHSTSEYPIYAIGEISGQAFDGVYRQKANFDTLRVVFTTEMLFSHKNSGKFHPDTKLGKGNGIDLEGNFNQMSHLKREMYHSVQTIQEQIGSTNYDAVKILGISNYNGFPSKKENLYILGLMQNELTEIKNVTGLSNLHDRYIVFEDVSPSPSVDKDGKSYKKYKLKIKGLDNNGLATIVAPASDVFVYTNENFMLCSKAFAENEPLGESSFYERNYEEKIGLENREPTTNKRYEDWFIEKDSGMQVEVDGFINALSQINNDADFYSNVKALVEDSAEDIWNQAVSTVQANNNANPDDRALYWSRIKMQVALKSHPYFDGGINNTDLDKLIVLFEEKSRNYKGVDFSNTPTGAKKILITGFDPFLLNEKHSLHGSYFNIRQSNPSGCVALALHNTQTPNGIGYIQTILVPVRYSDFDSSKNRTSGQGEGIIEKYIKPWLDEVDMVITISQALPNQYNIDKYATATRGGFVDNMNFERIAGSRSVNILGNSVLEWIETTLPNEFIATPVIINNEFKDKNGIIHNLNASGNDVPVTGEQMIEGPGGDYLSNEIFYRVAKLRKEWIKSKLPNVVTKPTGHFHIAKLQDESIKEDFSISKTQTLLNIVRTAINNGVTGI